VSEVRTIRRELDALLARRSEVWRQLGSYHERALEREIADLNASIERRWDELRVARTVARFGPQEAIMARARLDARLEREVLHGTNRLPVRAAPVSSSST
jgi:hypothetical protein